LSISRITRFIRLVEPNAVIGKIGDFQAGTIYFDTGFFPKGAKQTLASLKCANPKGMPITVI